MTSLLKTCDKKKTPKFSLISEKSFLVNSYIGFDHENDPVKRSNKGLSTTNYFEILLKIYQNQTHTKHIQK